MYYTGFISIINIGIAHFVTSFYLFQPWIEPFTGVKSIMLYGAFPRILQYLFCFIILLVLQKRITGFFSSFYMLFQDEKKAHNANESNKDVGELEMILEQLTEREREVFKLLVKGFTNAQIANHLCLSNGTVKNYVSVIYDKVGIKNRTTLILKYSPFFRSND